MEIINVETIKRDILKEVAEMLKEYEARMHKNESAQQLSLFNKRTRKKRGHILGDNEMRCKNMFRLKYLSFSVSMSKLINEHGYTRAQFWPREKDKEMTVILNKGEGKKISKMSSDKYLGVFDADICEKIYKFFHVPRTAESIILSVKDGVIITDKFSSQFVLTYNKEEL